MKPVYFPFTYISKPMAKLILSCFQHFAVYQPTTLMIPHEMRELEKTGLLDIRIPVKIDEDKIVTISRSYKNWMRSHSGTDLNFLKTGMAATPFFDEFSVSQIRSDIKKKLPEKPDPDLQARLFLGFTQEFDQNNAEVNQDLKSYEVKKRNLFKSLRGKEVEEGVHPSNERIEDQGNYMMAERIAAWTRLMLHDPEASNLFVTSSRAVFDYLLEKSPSAKQLLYIDTIPADRVEEKEFLIWKHRLMEYVDTVSIEKAPLSSSSHAIERPAVAVSSNTVCFRLYMAEGESPQEFFVRCGEIMLPTRAETGPKKTVKNILIGLIECNKSPRH